MAIPTKQLFNEFDGTASLAFTELSIDLLYTNSTNSISVTEIKSPVTIPFSTLATNVLVNEAWIEKIREIWGRHITDYKKLDFSVEFGPVPDGQKIEIKIAGSVLSNFTFIQSSRTILVAKREAYVVPLGGFNIHLSFLHQWINVL